MRRKINILGVIPARGGSKGIPHKNIVRLRGKPLIAYAVAAAKQSSLLDACVVSTDDPRIAQVARSYGADVPFLRPKRLAGDRASDIGFLRHALAWVGKHRGWHPDILVILQPTSPFRTGRDIDAVITKMKRHRCDSIRTVIHPSPYNPFKMWRFTNEQEIAMRPLLPTARYRRLGTDVPRQMLPRYVLQVGLVYATRAAFVRKGMVWGPKMCGFEMPQERFVDIDTSADLARAHTAGYRRGSGRCA